MKIGKFLEKVRMHEDGVAYRVVFLNDVYVYATSYRLSEIEPDNWFVFLIRNGRVVCVARVSSVVDIGLKKQEQCENIAEMLSGGMKNAEE